MKYDMLDKEIVKRVIDTFDNHNDARNEKYEQIKKKDNYWSSDRDRFVGRFFKKYVGKNFILMDKEIIAYHDTIDDCGFYNTCEPLSLYSREYRENSYHFRGVPVYRNSKKFLHVTYIHAVNQMYGRGYIEMACQDILDREFRYVLDYNTLKNAAVMGIMRKSVFIQLDELFGDIIPCHETYGYITKHVRTEAGLPKDHAIDARCISGNSYAETDGHYWIICKLRSNNRQIHKASILKGGIRKNNQAPREVHGYRLMDWVEYAGRPCLVNGRRQSGYFSLSDISGKVLVGSVSYKQLNLINHNNTYIMEEFL